MDKTIGALLICCAVGYLIGSVNFAVIISKTFKKQDIRQFGSGNAGFTNMLRVYGGKSAIATLIGDFLKGIVAVVLSRYLCDKMGIISFDPAYPAGLFVVVGHLFPLYFGFKGGKGVLTCGSIALIINPPIFLILLAVFLLFTLPTKYISLGSIMAAITFPISTYLLLSFQNRPALIDTFFAALMTGIILWMHRSNIVRLLNGTENKISPKRKGEK